VAVRARRDHDDRHVTQAADASADLESVDAGKHDVDQDDVGRLAGEGLQGLLSAGGLLDVPALLFEGEAHGGPDPLVVLHGEDARAHG